MTARAISSLFVNRSSRSTSRACAFVTSSLLAVLLSATVTNTAKADRVIVLRATGDVDETTLANAQLAVAQSLTAIGHELVAEQGALHADDSVLPENAGEMQAIAQVHQADWVVVAIVHDADESAYWTTLRVGHAADASLEELDIEVRRATESERLQRVLTLMIRPGGAGEEGIALAGEDQTGRQSEAERLAAQAAAEEEARRLEEARALAEAEAEAAAERERQEREAAEALAAEQAEFAERDRYGVADGLTMIQAGVAARFIVASEGTGVFLGGVELRVGRGFEAIPGLELRGGLEVVYGATSALNVFGGAAYLFSPFSAPLHLGASLELGMLIGFSGNRGPSFLARGSALMAYNVRGGFYLEASLPELQVLSYSGGVLSLGASVRAGLRF